MQKEAVDDAIAELPLDPLCDKDWETLEEALPILAEFNLATKYVRESDKNMHDAFLTKIFQLSRKESSASEVLPTLLDLRGGLKIRLVSSTVLAVTELMQGLLIHLEKKILVTKTLKNRQFYLAPLRSGTLYTLIPGVLFQHYPPQSDVLRPEIQYDDTSAAQ